VPKVPFYSSQHSEDHMDEAPTQNIATSSSYNSGTEYSSCSCHGMVTGRIRLCAPCQKQCMLETSHIRFSALCITLTFSIVSKWCIDCCMWTNCCYKWVSWKIKEYAIATQQHHFFPPHKLVWPQSQWQWPRLLMPKYATVCVVIIMLTLTYTWRIWH